MPLRGYLGGLFSGLLPENSPPRRQQAANRLVYYGATTTVSGGASNYINVYMTASTGSAQLQYTVASTSDSWMHYSAARALDDRQRAFDKDNAIAARRAKILLLRRLTPVQRATFRENNWFVVTGGKTGRRYRINAKGSICANIDVLAENDNGRVDHRLCAHAEPASVPTCDQLLTQKIMLEWAEEEFLSRANRHAA